MEEEKIISASDMQRYMKALNSVSSRLEGVLPFKKSYRLVEFKEEKSAEKTFREVISIYLIIVSSHYSFNT